MLMSKAVSKFEQGKMKVSGVFDGVVDSFVFDDPYCFIHENDKGKVKADGYEETDLKFKNRKGKAIKLIYKNASEIGKNRETYEKKGIVLYEADIPYVRRLMVDGSLKVGYKKENVAYVDIEVDDSKGFPKKGLNEILSIAVVKSDGKDNWFYIGDYDSEVDMLNEFEQFLNDNNLTVIAGWNVNFDYDYLVERMKNLKMRNRWLSYCNLLDLLGLYKNAVKGLEAYSLEEVSEHEGFERKHREKRVSEMKREELFEYNVYDAILCYEIDKRYGFSDVQIELANEVNLTIDLLTAVRIWDTVILRRLRELGYVAEHTMNGKKKGIVGALVLEAKSGVYDNVLYADFESLYPNVIVNEKIDIRGFEGEVIPHLVGKFLKRRLEFKKKYKETNEKSWDIKQNVMKVLINSVYGVMANESFRFFDEERAQMVTMKAREIITRTKQIFEELGFRVLYIDTDSVFVDFNVDVENKNKYAEFVVNEVNEMMKPYRLKIECIFKRLLFPVSERGAIKKRYVGMDEKGDFVWRGFEMRRSDYPRLIKEILNELIRKVFNGEKYNDIMVWLSNMKKRMYAGEFDDKLIIVKGIRDLNEYEVKQPHVRAYQIAKEKGWESTDGKIRFVYVGNDVMPILNENDLKNMRLNYKKYWDMVMSVVGRVINVFEDENQRRLMV
ncbi:MAG: DNA polymerase domain-containing protein [Candidatus Aenigmatarchaeota archaeon]